VQIQGLGKLNKSGIQDGMLIQRLPNLTGEHPNMPTSFLLFLHNPNLLAQFQHILPQEELPHFDFQQKRDEGREGNGSGTGDKSSEELSNSEGKKQAEGVGAIVSIGVEQMGQSTENYEGNELKEDQFKGDIGATNKVKKLKGNGKICNGDEKVTHFLANQDVVNAPKPFFITIAV